MAPLDASILVVDDESAVRKLICTILSSAGYQTLEAEDGLAGYELVERLRGGVRLVITDIQMPRMNGAELAVRLISEYPDLKILCISGYTDSMSPSGHYFLAKPFTATALCAMVEEVMGVSRSAPKERTAAERETENRTRTDLHVRLIAAEARLEVANQEYSRLMALCSDNRQMALQEAMTIRQAAFDEYSRALREWDEFLLHRISDDRHE